jgi:phospholipid transport system substrate-binding protein
MACGSLLPRLAEERSEMLRHAGSLARRQLLGSAATLLVLSLPGSVARALHSAAAAEQVVERLVEQVWRLLRTGALKDADGYSELLPIVEEQTDLSLLGRLALGRHWRIATPADQDEYLALFRRFVLQRFIERLDRYAGAELGELSERFEIRTSHTLNGRDVLVQSMLLAPGGAPLRIEWRLRAGDGQPVIIDLIVEGVSLLVTQRSEFAAVLERGGMDGLLAELRTRVGQQI